MDHDHAVLGHALTSQSIQPYGGILRQRDFSGVEAQLGCGGELVDVLPARAGGADEADLDVVLVDGKVAGNPQHGVHRKVENRQAQNSGFVLKLLCRAFSVPSPLAGEG